MIPRRIQLSRKKGWRKPEGAISVARPSKWGNPWKVCWGGPDHGWYVVGYDWLRFTGFTSQVEAAIIAVDKFREGAEHVIRYGPGAATPRFTAADLEELRGHDLACWCPLDQTCHAEVLLELANK